MNRSRHQTALMIACVAIAAGVTTAQPPALPPLLVAPAQPVPGVEIQQQLEKQIEQKRKAYVDHLELRIDELDRICELSDSQKKKLRIAAKGAADRATEGFRKQLMQMHQQLEVPLPVPAQAGILGPAADVEVFAAPAFAPAVVVPAEVPAEAPADARDAEGPLQPVAPNDAPPTAEEPPRAPVRQAVPPEPPAGEAFVDPQVLGPAVFAEGQNVVAIDVEADGMQFAFNGFFGGVNHNDARAVVKQSIWVATVAKVLSDEQRIALKKVTEQRTAFYRHSAVKQAIAILDFELLLSDVQRDALNALIDQSIGRQLTAIKLSELQSGYTQPQTIQQLFELVPKAKLSEILSETQMDAWTKLIKRWGNGFFQIQAAAAAAPF